MDRHKYGVVILIGDFDHLLQFAVVARQAHQSGKSAHAVVHVHHIIARLEEHDFFERQREFGVARVVRAEVEFVIAVEDLVVGEEREL